MNPGDPVPPSRPHALSPAAPVGAARAKPNLTTALLAMVALALSGRALADVIVLKNGSRIEGVVERTVPGPLCTKCLGKREVECPSCQGLKHTGPGARCSSCRGKGAVKCSACKGRGRGPGQYVIRARGGARTTISESQVALIQKSYIPPEELLPPRKSYAARLAKLTPGNAAEELALARWALRRGLHAEAAKHARSAERADRSLAGQARAVYGPAERKLVAGASRALEAALGEIRAERLKEGLRALEEVRREHATSPLLTDIERQRRFLKERAADLAGRYGRTLAEIERSAARRLKLACRTCGGTGFSHCPDCKGSGEGTCTACKGTGEGWCMECNSTSWRLCVRCGGTGKTRGTLIATSSACGECRARGVIECKKCKKGRLACPTCGGKGKVARACKSCGGKGKDPCAACLGTGLAKVTSLRWGPVREIAEAPSAGQEDARADAPREPRVPVWQGVRRGCIITVMRARDLHEGALTAQLGAVLGAGRELLAVCVDNRDGRDQVEFSPARDGLRLVTDDAKQIGAEPPPDVAKLSAKHPELRALLAELEAKSVLPGVTANAIGVFPAGTDLGTVASVYWGRKDPLRLKRRRIGTDALEQLRKTLR
ncbi:MAG: hypothetical protein ACYSU0_13520 [Planctomycetota bacterium]